MVGAYFQKRAGDETKKASDSYFFSNLTHSY